MLLAPCLAAAFLSLAYDPLITESGPAPRVADETWTDADRKRDIPVRIFLPSSSRPAPVVLFSHGLGGSRENNGFLGERLARRGYVAIFMQHPGSDESVWRGVPLGQRMGAMRTAANGQNLRARVEDVKFVLDRLNVLRETDDAVLQGRVDMSRIGICGHSFGAVTSQASTGHRYPVVGTTWADPRLKAAAMFSPSPSKGGDPKTQFGEVKVPWLLLTGTKDDAEVNNLAATERLKVFPALPPGDKFECVLDGAEHSAFSERALPGDQAKRNPNHHRVMLGLTVAFFDAYLRGDAEAKAWIKGSGPRSIMEPNDTWQKK